MKYTPLYESHITLGAKFVDFFGWQMPLYYTSIIEESKATRSNVGIFDVSHMGRFLITVDSLKFLDTLFTNDPQKLGIGKAQYTLLCNERGGIIDDTILINLDNKEFLLISNACNRYKVWNWLKLHSEDEAIEDVTERLSSIAIQGPNAKDLVEKMFDVELSGLKRFYILKLNVFIISRTGYTGEDGFEIFTPSDMISSLWGKALSLGGIPCGLGARDILRLEAGYCLYGNELSEDIDPITAGLERFIKLDNRNFIGSERIRELVISGTEERLVWFRMQDKVIPRKGDEIRYQGIKVGKVTSGSYSPKFDVGIGMGYVKSEIAKEGNTIEIIVRNSPRIGVISKR
ncbi:MAG: glycine cleavage system aminomethyltransferase GcvT [bacterium]|nr:glycine cleavage system aminomethyltransferase GcvT [bacterium]